MVIKDLICRMQNQLSGVTNVPSLEARLLLGKALNRDEIFILTHQDMPLSDEQTTSAMLLLEQRTNHRPMAYILGHKEFMSMDFMVNESVLIPRPDTECVVEEAVKLLSATNAVTVLEIGTGSGCIAMSMAKILPDIKVTAIDCSQDALRVAKENALLHDVADRVSFLQMDILKAAPAESYDCVISNPPYISAEEMACLAADIKEYEPSGALDGGMDGLTFYRRIVSLSCLKDGGYLIFEIGDTQAEAVQNLLQKNAFGDIRIIKDLAGADRGIVARKQKVGR